jgi:phosphohistidine phosphatase
MLLYLVQHAEAKKEEEDRSRPLSEKGKREIERMALHLSKLNLLVSRIVHSTKLRAKQTAEALSKGVKPSKEVAESDGLSPMDDPVVWAERLKYMTDSANEDIMLVGHLPHLGRLASLLLAGDPERNVVSFRMAGVVCLERGEKGTWSLKWMITPDVLG